MQDIYAIIKSDVGSRISGKVTIVGIGNIMRADDGLGPKFIEIAKNKNIDATFFDCGTAPENYILPILSTACDTVILVDAADFNAAPGSVKVIGLNEISRVSFSTHSLSPRLLIDLLRTGREDLNIFIISIQPKATTLGAPLSEDVMNGLNTLADIFTGLLPKK